MIHQNKSYSNHQQNDTDLVWFEVKCNRADESYKTEKLFEIKNVTDGSTRNDEWIPDKIEKNGNWFSVDTHFNDDPAFEDGNEKKTIQILCCNLTQPENCNNPTMLFHIDYWKKQFAQKIK